MDESGAVKVRCGECGTRIDVSRIAPFTKISCPGCGASFHVKSEFGPFKLVRLHAIGGMSMVFAAHDATLDREVALKILNEDYSADETRIAAFEQEARITASLSHPNVVRVFKTGRAFGRFYIAMEMVPGGHLEERIREQGKIPEAELLPLAIEVALGLQAAHNAGLIHRDVKPGNILLDAQGHARLVDFGLALVTQGGKALASEIWATPYYVPPEAIEGRAEDFRSDIYAFGSTLYHVLSGRPPCGEESMSTDALREAKKKITPLGKVEPSVSAAICRIVDKAMAHEPARRFTSYHELIADLRNARRMLDSGADGHAGALASAAQVRSRRLPGWVVGAAVAVPVLLAIAFWPREKPAAPPPPAAVGGPERAVPTAPVAPADNSAEIARIHREGRAALERGDYPAASRSFAKLLANERVLEPTRSWAAIEAVLAAFLNGDSRHARAHAQAARAHLATLPQDHPLAGEEWSALLEAVDGFPPLPCPQAADSAAGVAAAMLAGLKNWEQGMLDRAAECFRTAASARPVDSEAWIAIYQKLAGDYLADHEILTSPAFRQEPADLAAGEALLARLDELAPTLRTRGRAPFNLDAWRRDVRYRALRFARDGPPPPAPAPPGNDDDVIARLSELAAGWRFDEALEYLENMSADPAGATRESLLDIVRAAAAFTTDLERDLATRPYQGELFLKSGRSIVRLAVSADGSLAANTADGAEIPIEWADFTADSLIDLHRALVSNSDSEIERLRRHECAIAYDWLVGNRARALTAATKLGQSSPAFNRRWQRILAGLPQ